MELLVGMIISSIVIGFGYSGYSLIYRQFLSFKKMKTETIQAAQFQFVFNTDLYNSEKVFFQEGKVDLRKKERIIQYQFGDSLVYRTNNNVTDTFNIKARELSAHYTLNGQTLIDRLSFKARILNEEESFSFCKIYSAETLIRQEQAHED